MKGASKLIMGITLAMAIALAIVLLVLLADFCFSLLLLRRRRKSPPTTATASTSPQSLPAPGVLLHPPRSFLFPNNTETNANTPVDDSPLEHLVYICNPIYEAPCGAHTPYETPQSSPSRLGCSDDDQEREDDEYICVCVYSPQLKPMKKLQPEACSVSLRDTNSLATSASGSDTNSTASGSPRIFLGVILSCLGV